MHGRQDAGKENVLAKALGRNRTSRTYVDTCKRRFRDFPGGPVVDSELPLQGAWAPSLVGESHKLCGVAKKKKQNKNKKRGFISVDS